MECHLLIVSLISRDEVSFSEWNVKSAHMKTYCVICLSLMLSTAGLLADPPVDTSGLPSPVQRTIDQSIGKGGKVQRVFTRRVDGQVVYEVEYKERGDEKMMVIAQDGVVVSQENNGKGKGKGKAKGKDKGKDRGEEDRDTVSAQADPAPARSAAAPRDAVSAPRAETPVPAVRNPAPAPRAETTATATRTAPTREMKAEFNRRIDRMSKLDNNREAVAAGLAAIEKETGVSRATLQAQIKSASVGLSTLVIANEIAREKGVPATTVFKERRNGRTWETIANNHQYDMTAVFPKLERVEAAMAKAARQ